MCQILFFAWILSNLIVLVCIRYYLQRFGYYYHYVLVLIWQSYIIFRQTMVLKKVMLNVSFSKIIPVHLVFSPEKHLRFFCRSWKTVLVGSLILLDCLACQSIIDPSFRIFWQKQVLSCFLSNLIVIIPVFLLLA